MSTSYKPPPDLAAANAVTEAGQEWLKYECVVATPEQLAFAEEHVAATESELAHLTERLAALVVSARLGLLRLARATTQFLGLEGRHSWAVAFLLGVVALACVAPPVLLARPAGRTGVFIFLVTYLTSVVVILTLLLSCRRAGVDETIDEIRRQRHMRKARAADLELVLTAANERVRYLKAARAAQLKHEQAVREYERIKHLLASERYQLSNAEWRSLRGVAFEQFLARVFRMLGYDVQTTKTTGDQGVDLVVRGQGRTIAVQTKGYAESVGNTAVQQVVAGRIYYDCEVCAVVTNSQFTSGARALADKAKCALIDGDAIPELIAGRIF